MSKFIELEKKMVNGKTKKFSLLISSIKIVSENHTSEDANSIVTIVVASGLVNYFVANEYKDIMKMLNKPEVSNNPFLKVTAKNSGLSHMILIDDITKVSGTSSGIGSFIKYGKEENSITVNELVDKIEDTIKEYYGTVNESNRINNRKLRMIDGD